MLPNQTNFNQIKKIPHGGWNLGCLINEREITVKKTDPRKVSGGHGAKKYEVMKSRIAWTLYKGRRYFSLDFGSQRERSVCGVWVGQVKSMWALTTQPHCLTSLVQFFFFLVSSEIIILNLVKFRRLWSRSNTKWSFLWCNNGLLAY